MPRITLVCALAKPNGSAVAASPAAPAFSSERREMIECGMTIFPVCALGPRDGRVLAEEKCKQRAKPGSEVFVAKSVGESGACARDAMQAPCAGARENA